jgi:glycosyltransferase involved in cell wall biosynthesis
MAVAKGVDPSRYQIRVCFLKDGPLAEEMRRSGIGFTCVNWSGTAKDLLGSVRYASLLRCGHFDIIHQHTGGRLLTGAGRWMTHAKIVRTLHFRADESTGAIPSDFKLPAGHALIAVSRAIADFSQDPRAILIYPGIDASVFSGTRNPHEGIVIGTACRLEPVKGVIHLLEALAMLAGEFSGLRLEIAGDGSLRSRLEQENKRLGIANRVSFLGWRDDLSAVMTGWDIFAMPSLDEGLPIAGLEAMAAGLPVVASAVGGLRELVVDGETGWLVPAAEAPELARRLRELIRDKQIREAMGRAGRQRVLREFSVARMVDQTVAVYDGLSTE